MDRELENYSQLTQDARSFSERSDVDPQLRAEINEIIRQTLLKRCEVLEHQGKKVEAAEAYLDFAKAFAESDPVRVEIALFNASIAFTGLSQWSAAADAEGRYLRQFTKGKRRSIVLLQLAKNRERVARLK